MYAQIINVQWIRIVAFERPLGGSVTPFRNTTNRRNSFCLRLYLPTRHQEWRLEQCCNLQCVWWQTIILGSARSERGISRHMRDYDRKGLLNIADNVLLYIEKYFLYQKLWVGRYSVVGIGTRQDLDGQGMESRCGGKIFRTSLDRPRDLSNFLHSV